MTDTLQLTDPASLEDLGRFAARARAIDADGAMRLQATGAVLAAWVGVLPGSGILAEGTVLGLRTFALATHVTAITVSTCAMLKSKCSRFDVGGST